MRTCDWAWFDKIILTWFTPTPPRKDISKTAIWAEMYVDWEYYEDVVEIIEKLIDENVLIIVLEQAVWSVMLDEIKVPKDKDICIVLWNEITWVSRKIIDKAGLLVEIPMFWKKKSLNVATSAGILMYRFL